jgi:pre-rRNA-processing protein TSR4
LYTHQDTVAAQVLGTNTSIPVCPRCGAKRTFEMQLMPGLMQMLETSRYAEQQDDTSGGSTNGVSGLDSFDLGMEWGTILIYTCSRDCFDRGFDAPNAVITHGAVRYHEELALVQHEV